MITCCFYDSHHQLHYCYYHFQVYNLNFNFNFITIISLTIVSSSINISQSNFLHIFNCLNDFDFYSLLIIVGITLSITINLMSQFVLFIDEFLNLTIKINYNHFSNCLDYSILLLLFCLIIIIINRIPHKDLTCFLYFLILIVVKYWI